MRRVIVDTNVLVSMLTDRDAEQQARAAALFEAAEARELEIVLHQVVIAEMVYVLGNLYGVGKSEISAVIDDLLASPCARAIHDLVWSRVLDLWPSRVGDFTDGILASVALEKDYAEIATFDRRFEQSLHRLGIDCYWPRAPIRDDGSRV